MEVGLVSCTKSKRNAPAKPAELYLKSALFEKARRYVETHHADWYILSAKHGLLDPDGPPIEPYDETLSGAPIERKRNWASNVAKQMQDRGVISPGNCLVFHAGRDYYGELTPLLTDYDIEISIPTEGLRYGETLAWYNDEL